MVSLLLHRNRFTPDGTFGILSLKNRPLCVTCENPWKDNLPRESCIPPGTYQCKAFNGVRYKNVWEVTNVPGRSAILFHHGNTIRDTEGCILVGRGFSTLNGLPSITESVTTLNMLRTVLPPEFTLPEPPS